jgi:hypothetical protein
VLQATVSRSSRDRRLAAILGFGGHAASVHGHDAHRERLLEAGLQSPLQPS